MHLTRRTIVFGAAASVLVAATGLTAGFVLGSGSDDRATAAVQPTTPIPPNSTPGPSETPDTSKALWYVPWENQEAALPRYNQAIAGIELGPTVGSGNVICSGGLGSVIVEPTYLPAGSKPDPVESHASKCENGVVAADEKHYSIPPNEGDLRRVRAGELSFFGSRHGGFFYVLRMRVDRAAYETGFASARLAPGTIAGHPAAIGSPIFPAGFGVALVIVFDQSTSILTVVRADSLPLDEVLRIAEGVAK